MKMKVRTLFLVLFFAGILVVTSYVDNNSQQSFDSLSHLSLDGGAVETSADEDEAEQLNMSVKEVHVKTEKRGGYRIEVYEQVNVYRDDKGKVVKKVPTGEYQTLKYKLDEKK
ncbi:Uncharacterised protein [Priestia megaterium]|uniref:hypothetical protein n=1 Tax=Priestia megaterium TaxID=1404 RepID=UPI000E14AA5F|nr:hypothetical protein [Priestia megaterium]SUV08805.1 Uncharacterised protein [Priestia megaterium]